MKKISIYLAATVALLVLSGCNREVAPDVSGEITVRASIGATKVTNQGDASAFEAGDQIAVYAWMGGATEVPATRVVDGVKNTLGTDGKWTPEKPMLWKTVTDTHYFLGVFPAKDITDFTADPYTLNPAEYTASDLLIATNLDGVKASGGDVPLVFSHAMAKLNVNLKFRSQWDATPTVTSVTVTAKKTATVNYLTKAVTATGNASEVDIPAAATAATGYALSYSGLQV
nr:fimbrillin family protein [Bacteroidales bacterium]